MKPEIDDIRRCFREDRAIYSQHARAEMTRDEFGRIWDEDIEMVIETGRIIRHYPEDRPFESVLIGGLTKSELPLHIVVAWNWKEDRIIIITAYRPDPSIWLDLITRRN